MICDAMTGMWRHGYEVCMKYAIGVTRQVLPF